MSASVLHLAALAAVVFQALLFLRAAWHKASDYGRFHGFLADYRLLPDGLLGVVSRGLIGAELAVVVLLICPPLSMWGALGAAGLLSLYAGAIAINVLRGRERVECGCGGAAQRLSWALVLRNLVLVAVAVLAMFCEVSATTALEVAVAVVSGGLAWCAYLIAEQIMANLAPLLLARKVNDLH